MKIRLFVLISILVLLTVYLFVYIFSHVPHRYESYNWIARLAAPNFILPLDTIEQTDQNSLIDEYKRRGYKIKCYGNLRPEEKISKIDDYVCWGIIKSAYDNIPAKEMAFIFSKRQLHFVRIEFPASSFEKLKDYLNRKLANYQRLDQIPEMKSETDIFGKPLITWIVRKGYITTSASPTPDQPLILMWTSRSLNPGLTTENTQSAQEPADLKNILPLSPSQPPRELASNAEIILISGYEPAGANKTGTTVKVVVNRPGSKVLLVLTSYEKINWQVSASPTTTISGIVTAGYETPNVMTSMPAQGYLVKLPYACEIENVNFKELLTTLNNWFGINKVDVFRGSYAIPYLISISALDPPRAELTVSGQSPQTPSKNFTFNIITTNFQKSVWSLTGPVQKSAESYIEKGRITISPSGKKNYRLTNDNIEIFNQRGGQHTTIPLPPNFPNFSWAKDIAYDTERDIVSVVTLGGEGFLYRFDAKKSKWIDFRSLNNIDIYSLSYDRSMDRYVAWTDRGNLLFISGDGNALFKKEVLLKLVGFGRLYDSGNGPSPRLTIAPNGNDIALIYVSGNFVKNIWYYNVENDTAVLTYQK